MLPRVGLQLITVQQENNTNMYVGPLNPWNKFLYVLILYDRAANHAHIEPWFTSISAQCDICMMTFLLLYKPSIAQPSKRAKLLIKNKIYYYRLEVEIGINLL